MECTVIPDPKNSLGIDSVLNGDTFLATSQAELLPSEKAFRKSEARLARVSQKKSLKKKGSAVRRKLAKKEAKIHQNIARSRKDHHFVTAHQLAKSGRNIFFVEDLQLKNLIKRNKAKLDETGKFLPNRQAQKSGLNKSFLDAGFGQFVDILSYIAKPSAAGGFPAVGDWREKAGGQVIKVKPNYTSQICCSIDALVPKGLADRVHDCKACGLIVDRDINAAIAILNES